MPILNMNYWANKGWANIGEPTNISATTASDSATIKWTDGDDLNTIPPATFFKSVLVRKVGSAPTSPIDWTLVETETVKNTYSSNGYTDAWLTYWTTYYYQVFSYSDLWGITYWTPVSVTPSTIVERPDLDQYSLLSTATLTWFNGPHAICVSEDGTKLYIWPATWLIRQYSMSGGLLSNITSEESNSWSSVDTRWLYCKPDGTLLFSTSDRHKITMSMSTPYSLTWCTISTLSSDIWGISDLWGCWFTPDGNYLIVCCPSNTNVAKVPCTTPRDLSTATATWMTTTSALGYVPADVAISPTWLKMFVWQVWESSNYIKQYNLSTAWDITTAVDSGKSLWWWNRALFGVTWTWDIFVTDSTSTPTVYQYTAS